MAGVFSRILTRIGRFFGSEQRSTTYRKPAPWLLTYAKSGAVVGEETTIGISAVFQGLRFISSAIAAMPRTVVEEDDNENITFRKSHPLQRLLSIEAHRNYSAYDFFFALIWQTKLRGNGIAVINYNETTARPESLSLIEWKDVFDVSTDNDSGFTTYKIKGYARELYGYEVIHLKNATADGVTGVDTLKVHLDNFGLDLASRDIANKIFNNGAMLSGYLTTERPISPDSRESMEKSWNARYTGLENAGKTPLLEGGLKYERIAMTPQEAGLSETRQFNVYEVARILGLSPHVLYALDRANFSNIETLHQEIGKYTLAPLVCALEDELNRKLFREAEVGRLRVMFNMDSFTRGDTESRSKYLKEMVQNGIFTINEARRMEGKNSVEYGDAFLIPKNMTLVSPDGRVMLQPDAVPGENQEDTTPEGDEALNTVENEQ